LGVRAVLQGRVVQRGDNLAVSVELVDTKDDNLIWREQYSRKMGDILMIEQEISKEVYSQLRLKLTGEEKQQVAKRPTENVEAYQLYLRGLYGRDRVTEESSANNLQYLQQATELDPRFASAWDALATNYMQLGVYSVRPRSEIYQQARNAALRALELDDTLAGPHATLGRLKTDYEWDWDGAEREFKRALDLDPNSASAHQGYGVFLAATGRPLEAIAEAKRASDLEPLSPLWHVNVGWMYYVAHRYEEAEKQCRRTVEMDPNYPWGHNCLGSIYLQTGRAQDALNELRRAVVLSKRGLQELTYLGHALGISGDRAGARKVLDEMIDSSQRRFIPPEFVAVVYEGLGDRDRAFQWFGKAVAAQAMHAWVYPDPRQDPFRSDPRFGDLMKRIGLSPATR
jgi:tetratricopeptide (TPR) repeat protein